MSSGKSEEQTRDADTPSLPEDIATLYSWANVRGAKYHDFSAARREARSQPRSHTRTEATALTPAAPQIPTVPEKELKAVPPVVPAPQAKPKSSARRTWEELSATKAEAVPSISRDVPAPATVRGSIASVTAKPEQPAARSAETTEAAPPEKLTASAVPRANTLPVESVPAAEPHPFSSDTPHVPTVDISPRWTALDSFADRRAPIENLPQRARPLQPPVLAVFSLAGGVGKTSLVATLGRALAAHGENVLLVDTNSYGLLPLYYGAHDVRPGAVRTFSNGAGDAAVQLLTLDVNRVPGAERVSADGRGWLTDEITRSAVNTSRVLIDVATASASLARQVLRLLPRVIVPLAPDVSSVASLHAVEAFFTRQSEGLFIEPVYVLNNFDESLPLHLEMRELLRQKLGDRLLPFALRRSPAMAEALADGMTVIDFAPNTPIAGDFSSLSTWLRGVSAPAGNAFRRKRWNEISREQ